MSLGSDQLGKEKAVIKKGLADGVEFKSNPYEVLDELFHDESEEIVVSTRNKYFAYGAKKFLEDMNLTFMESDVDEPRLVISLVNSTFKFINHMEDLVTLELPYDWDAMENDVRAYIRENPIVKKEKTYSNEEMWSTPPQTQEEKDAIDEVKDYVKQIQRSLNVSASEAAKMAKKYIKGLYHGKNRTVYTAKGNPDLNLRSGVYTHIEDLMRKNKWLVQFESSYGKTIREYMRDFQDKEDVEKSLLTEFGFDHIIDDIEVTEHKFWTNRTIEVKYKDQDDSVMPEMTEEDFDPSNNTIHENQVINNPQPPMGNIPQGMGVPSNANVSRDDRGEYQVIETYNNEDAVFIVGCLIEGRTENVSLTSKYTYFVVDNGEEIIEVESDGHINILSMREFDRYQDQIFSSGMGVVMIPNMDGDIGGVMESGSMKRTDFNVYLSNILDQYDTEYTFKVVPPKGVRTLEVLEDTYEIALRTIKKGENTQTSDNTQISNGVTLEEGEKRLSNMVGFSIGSYDERVEGREIIRDYWGDISPQEVKNMIESFDDCVFVKNPINLKDCRWYQYSEVDDNSGRCFSMGILTDNNDDVISYFYTED